MHVSGSCTRPSPVHFKLHVEVSMLLRPQRLHCGQAATALPTWLHCSTRGHQKAGLEQEVSPLHSVVEEPW
ncbi:hypothetical protein U0070_010882 [Myodes glareolus]|uniref:Uncharacterized protein n=1 Tax=Myodes glareolus TaxID=447135 RepID=A0AAW0HYM6_MYOGA